MSQEKRGLRMDMPATAELVDELRLAFGSALVDKALAAGQQARREFRRLEAEKGLAHAVAWASRQKWPHGRFWASEDGFEVGLKVD